MPHNDLLPVVRHIVPEGTVAALDSAQELDSQVVAHQVATHEVIFDEEAFLWVLAPTSTIAKLHHIYIFALYLSD